MDGNKLDQYIADSTSLRKATLCLLLKDGSILLAMKKRGFGVGRWNGVGGKVENDESVEHAVRRETLEEIGVVLDEISRVATLWFYFEGKPEWNQEVAVYTSSSWIGKPSESEEMSPKWFSRTEIPFESMWPDDTYWLPEVLDGKHVNGHFLFDSEQKLLEFKVEEINA